jgi:cytochrome c-type biogenesis protein CcmH
MRFLAALLLAATLGSAAAATLDAQQEARYHRLVNELRCLVCQNQNIADSNAPLAADLRAQVERQVLEGRSDREILDYMTARYGDFVLYRPPFAARNWVLWLGPFALVLGGAAGIAVYVRRRPRAAAAPVAPVDEAALERLLREPRE